jgi:hypothetical protein
MIEAEEELARHVQNGEEAAGPADGRFDQRRSRHHRDQESDGKADELRTTWGEGGFGRVPGSLVNQRRSIRTQSPGDR